MLTSLGYWARVKVQTMDAVRVYELPCSVMVVMNFLPPAADRVRFGLLPKYDDAYLCPPPRVVAL